MSDHNTVVISGRLSRDPELRYIPSGDAVAEFSVAINETYEKKDGEKKESTTFIDCKAWRGNAEKIAKQKKGDSVMVVGKLRVDSWDDKESGKKRYKTYVLADAVTNPYAGSTKAGQPKQAPAPKPAPARAAVEAEIEEILPF